MKFTPSAFQRDTCEISWRDLLKLAIGREIRSGSLRLARLGKLETMKTQFANEGSEIITMLNELSLGADGMAHIAPLGDFPGMAMIPDGKGGYTKAKAIQRMDAEAVTQMANEYKSGTRGVSGYFKKRPLFVGHPDMPGFERQYPDKSPKGIFQNIVARDGGLYGELNLTDEGDQLVASKKYRALSGRWEAEFVCEENGVNIYRPTKFISAGLTNQPNLPVQLLNEAETATLKENMKKLTAWLQKHGITIANEAMEEQVATALAQLDTKLESAVTLANDKATAEGKVTTLTEENQTITNQLAASQSQFANEREKRIDAELGYALKDGRITGSEQATWKNRLGIPAQFANELTALQAIKPVVKTTPVTIDRGGNKVEIANEDQRRAVTQEVLVEIANEKKLNLAKDYDKVWTEAVKRHPALFGAMQHPKVKAR